MHWLRKNERLDDLDRELRADLELEIEEQMANGLPPQEARFAARRALGNMPLIKEQTREAWGGLWLEMLLKDIHYAVRGLFKSPLFTIVCVLSLALGVGVTTGIFGIFEAVFVNAVSARNANQLRRIEPGSPDVSYLDYQYLSSTKNAAVVGLIAFTEGSLSFRSGNDFASITGDIVSPKFFDVLGVTPAIGRGFSVEDQQPERQPQVVILSHTFWKREFDATPDILGKIIELNHHAFTVIGVLPKDYRSVHGYGMVPEVYVPFNKLLVGDLANPGLGNLQLIARVQDGVSIEQLRSFFVPLVQGWMQLYPADKRYSGPVEAYPLTGIERMRRDGVPVELTVFMALLILVAVLVLLIGCANVAGLLVARGVNRTREIAVRIALGAARYRLIQQLLTESAVLALLGVCVGVTFYLALAAMISTLQLRASVPLELHLRLDRHILYFCSGLVVATTLLSGLVPALQTSRRRWHLGSSQIGTETHQRSLLRRAMVVGQFAFAFILLVSASLFLRGLEKNSHMNPGFNVQHLLTAEVSLDTSSYPPTRSEQYFQNAIAELSRLPGIRSASGASVVPLGIEHWVMSAKVGENIVQRVFANTITPGYFRTMQIPLLQGRDFQSEDRVDGVKVAIINQTFATTYFKNNAVGNLIYVPIPGNPPQLSPFKVVGVVSDSKYGSLGEEPMPALYWPATQDYRPLAIEISTDSAPAESLEAVRQTLVSLDSSVPIKIELMQERLAGALLPGKIASLVLSGIGALGLLLAAIGIYGVVAYSVGRRTAEIGIRMALGATKTNVLGLILKDASKLVCMGMVVGSILALFVVQSLGKTLPAGMKVVDPLSFAMVGCVLAMVALMAAFIPAWRGSHIDPNVALRSD